MQPLALMSQLACEGRRGPPVVQKPVCIQVPGDHWILLTNGDVINTIYGIYNSPMLVPRQLPCFPCRCPFVGQMSSGLRSSKQ